MKVRHKESPNVYQQKTSDAYMEGEEARSLGWSRNENPYQRGTKSFVEWLQGWFDESKRGY